MCRLIAGPMRSRYELPGETALDVRLEELVWIIKIRKNQGELTEVLAQLRVKFDARREESGQGAGLDRKAALGQAGGNGKRGYVRIAKNFEVSLGKTFSQRAQNRERQDEI